jgi:predicted dehydrogenase
MVKRNPAVNQKDASRLISRRGFLARAAIASAFPLMVPSRLLGADSPGNRVRLGHIGCGRIATVHDMPNVIKANLADVVAVCDLDTKRAAAGGATIKNLCRDNEIKPHYISVYYDYRELLARKDIDAVVISLPDHWHAQIALAAALAGKDIYLQKPFTMTLNEGILLRDTLVRKNCVFQVGSQQRSWGPNYQFRKACEFVRSGRVGQLQRVEIGLPIDPTAPDDPPQPVPHNLNYDLWLGPTENAYYTEQRVHSQKDIISRPGWLRHDAYCLGMITGWGAHHFDTAHWGMDCELTGPSRIEGRADFPKNKIWNVHGACEIELLYPRGIHLHVSDRFPTGIKFIGDEGWIFVTRENTKVSASDPNSKTGDLKPLDASDPKLLDPNGVTVKLYESAEHHHNWLECVKSRQPTAAPAPIAHRSTSACIVSWIAMKLGRPLNWDADKERFIDDDEANSMLSRPERAPYGAERMART